MLPGLNLKQQRFISEYLIEPNSKTAAVRAGYAANTGGLLLSKPLVIAEIERRRLKLANKMEITAERVLREYARIAFADSRQIMSWGPDGVTLRDSTELTDDEAAAVAEVAETLGTDKGGGSIRLKTHSKIAALEALAKHLHLFPDQVIDQRQQTVYASDAIIAAILEARSQISAK